MYQSAKANQMAGAAKPIVKPCRRNEMNKINQVVARVFLGHIFLLAGIKKIGAYAGTQGYMETVGVPGCQTGLEG